MLVCSWFVGRIPDLYEPGGPGFVTPVYARAMHGEVTEHNNISCLRLDRLGPADWPLPRRQVVVAFLNVLQRPELVAPLYYCDAPFLLGRRVQVEDTSCHSVQRVRKEGVVLV